MSGRLETVPTCLRAEIGLRHLMPIPPKYLSWEGVNSQGGKLKSKSLSYTKKDSYKEKEFG